MLTTLAAAIDNTPIPSAFLITGINRQFGHLGGFLDDFVLLFCDGVGVLNSAHTGIPL